MALGANTIWDVRTTGSDTLNGGAFDPGQSAGFFTDGAATVATANSPVFTSASYNFVAGDVSAWLYIASGTNWTPGWYQIASVAANAATLTATIGTAVIKNTMAANTVAGCATVTSPTVATWTIDYSQQNAAQFVYTDLASAGAGLTISSSLKPFAKQQVGNSIVITGGTNFTTGNYVIASVAAGVATVVGPGNITTGVGASGTGGQGGSLATIAQVATVAVGSNSCYVKAGTYNISTQIDTGATWSSYLIEGYNTVRGDGRTLTRPVLKATAAIVMLKARNNGSCILRNLDADGNSATGTDGVLQANSGSNSCVLLDNCTIHNWSGSGVRVDTSSAFTTLLRGCDIYSCNYGLGDNSVGLAANAVGCVFRNCTLDGTRRAQGVFADCLAYFNGANGFENGQNNTTTYVNCTAYGNAGSGFGSAIGNIRRSHYLSCISYGNTAFGFSQTSSDPAVAYNCATGNNTSGAFSGITQVTGNVLLTADPFTNKAGNDFSLNNTAGGGAACRAAGFPGAFPGGTTTGYLDIGAVQNLTVVNPTSSSTGFLQLGYLTT